MLEKRNPNSCFIELNPKCDENYWTGEIEVNIIMSEKNKMDSESKESLLHLSQMVAATVALMEQDPQLTVRLENFLDNEDSFMHKNRKQIETKTEGNVITLNFKNNK